jgi:exosome complex component RRP42
VCSVKADLVHPSPSKPNQGILELNVDLSLCGGGGTLEGSSAGGGGAQKRRRQQREEESQITSLLQRLILPHAVNHEKLVVCPGKYVWRLAIDVMVLRCDGCVLDASSIAIREALQNTKLPKVQAVMEGGNEDATNVGSASKNDLLVDGDHHKAVSPCGAEDCPLVITVSVLSSPPSATDAVTSTTRSKRYKSIAIIDARTEEEACASSRVCVTVDTNGMVCGVHTLGGGGAGMEEEEGEEGGAAVGGSSMPISMLGEVVSTASMAAKNLYAKLDLERQVGKVKDMSSVDDNDCGYGYLLKNHFLIQ